MNSVPTPLPQAQSPTGERAWITYARAGGFFLPGLLAIVFCRVVLIPKLKRFFELTHEQWDRAFVGHYFEQITTFVPGYWPLMMSGLIGVFAVLELRWKRWPRYRGAVVMITTVLFNAVLLFGLVAIASAMGITGPQAGMQSAKKAAQVQAERSARERKD
ncbi:MAG: hypothetical protein JNM99_19350 [Verrucomicrobiaceae bacterium]|nr:hypothetical protein [Verrucomicrobiaceae bacterium]